MNSKTMSTFLAVHKSSSILFYQSHYPDPEAANLANDLLRVRDKPFYDFRIA